MIWLVLYAVMTAVSYCGSRIVNRQITARWRVSRLTSFLLAVLWPLMNVWWILRFFLYKWNIMTQPEDMYPKR